MEVGQYLFRDASAVRLELATQNRNLIRVRWVYAAIIAIAAVGAGLLARVPEVLQYSSIVAAVLLLNGVLYIASRVSSEKIRYYKGLALAQILLDLGMATAAIVVGGGVEARTIILYVIPLLVSGLFFGNSWLVYITAGLSAVSYSATIIVFELVHGRALELSEILVPVIFYGTLFFVIARIMLRFNERTQEAARNRSYEELLAMMTHQLRHPSSTMGAILDAMTTSKSLRLNPVTAHYVDMLQDENNNFQHLTNNLLEAARVTDDEHGESVDIGDLITKVATKSAHTHRRDNDVRIEVPPEVVLVHGDVERFGVVFENLMDNALRYSRKGDAITIKLLSTATENKRPTVVIKDIGVGMNDEQRNELFKKFSRTTVPQGAIPGAGLGLFVCKKILTAYGGALAIRTSNDGGTEVNITLKGVPDGRPKTT